MGNLFNAFLYGLVGVVWIINGLVRGTGYRIFVGLVWLSGTVIFLVRDYREKHKEE